MTKLLTGFGFVFMLSFYASAAAAVTQADKMKECLSVDDMTKERLDCFDAIIKPEPKPTKAKARKVSDCRFLKEEDERLICFNKFAEIKPKKSAKKKKAAAPPPPQ
jgi:hypothetical protein